MYILEKQVKEFTKGKNEPKKIGGLNKANKAIRTQNAIRAIEEEFMNISFKANRSDNQAKERRAKR